MQYQSPFELLGITPEEFSATSFNPVILRKKLLAEFELSGNPTIKVPGGELSKNDVLELIEEIRDPRILNYHQTIYQDDVLLEFLLSNHIEGNFRFASNPLYNDEEFLQFLSPFFISAFCEFISNCLNDSDYCRISLQKFPFLVVRGNEYESLEPVRIQIHNFIDDIKLLTNKLEYTEDERINPELMRLWGDHVINTINMLPDRYFEHEIEYFFRSGIILIDACIREDRRGYRNIVVVRYVLTQLEKMTCPAQFTEGFEKIRKYLNYNRKIETNNSPNYRMIIRVLFFLGIIIFNTAKFWTSDNSHPTYSSTNLYTNELPDEQQKKMSNFTGKDSNYKNLIISLRTPEKSGKDSIPKYETFHTGDNPFFYLESTNSVTTGPPFKMTFKNQTEFDVVLLINNRFGNSFIYIAPNESCHMGTYCDSSTIAVLAGKRWDSNYHLPKIIGLTENGMQKEYKFKGNFRIKAVNYQKLLAPRKYVFPFDESGEFSITLINKIIQIESNYPSRKISYNEL